MDSHAARPGSAEKLLPFFDALDRFTDALPLDDLTTLMRQHDLTAEDFTPFIRFSSERYQRNLVHEGPAYQALVLCWRNGQRSPIHDHRGSACGVKILRGSATETIFDRAPNGQIFATQSITASAGEIVGSFDNDIHQISNLQADGADLVSLHIYSPPLLRMGSYSLMDADVAEYVPSNGLPLFAAGGGI